MECYKPLLAHDIPKRPFANRRRRYLEVLRPFFENFGVVVTVHGFRRNAFPRHAMLDGRNRTLAAHLARTLRPRLPGAVVVDDISKIPRSIRGVHPDNPVNIPRLGGVQLELSPLLRSRPEDLGEALARAARTFVPGW